MLIIGTYLPTQVPSSVKQTCARSRHTHTIQAAKGDMSLLLAVSRPCHWPTALFEALSFHLHEATDQAIGSGRILDATSQLIGKVTADSSALVDEIREQISA